MNDEPVTNDSDNPCFEQLLAVLSAHGTARRRLLLEAGTIAGRPVVILEDKPLGAAARILTLDRVTLQEP